MSDASVILIGLMVAAWAWPYALYPLSMLAIGAVRRRSVAPVSDVAEGTGDDWPTVSVSLPAYNEADDIAETLDALLAADYPEDRMEIVVISDASDDGTDAIVRAYADRGVELLRLDQRSGKTAAENAGVSRLGGSIVVNTDASVRVAPDAIKALVAAFRDPTVGVASGRDVSVAGGGPAARDANVGERGYVGYEMWLRELETRAGSIVGASGCLYAIRRDLHEGPVPPHLSRDFMAVLRAREAGYRSVSVSEAVCYVPRTSSLRREFHRKLRTITRGIQTLLDRRHLLDPRRQGVFAYSLASHKLARWLAPLGVLPGLAGLVLAAGDSSVAAAGLVAAAAIVGTGLVAVLRDRPAEGGLGEVVNGMGFAVLANGAALLAWIRVLAGADYAVWRPTNRGGEGTGE